MKLHYGSLSGRDLWGVSDSDNGWGCGIASATDCGGRRGRGSDLLRDAGNRGGAGISLEL